MPPKIIKRYANRKLYDTERSCYVTLEEIAEMVKGGEDVRIIDNRTGEDLSSVTLAQIVYEEEKKQKSVLSMAALREIIQSGGDFLQRRVAQPVQEMLHRPEEAVAGGPGAAGEGAGEGAAHAVVEEGPSAITAFLERSQEAFEDLQRKVDERIHKVLDTMTQLPALQREVVTLRERIQVLEARIEELEQPEEPAAGKKSGGKKSGGKKSAAKG